MNQILVDKVSIALDETQRLLSQIPAWKPAEVAREQLVLIQDIARGDRTDSESLKMVNLGLLAAREFEDGWPEYAALLFEIQGLVKNK